MTKTQSFVTAILVALAVIIVAFFALTPSSSAYAKFNSEVTKKIFAGDPSFATSAQLKDLATAVKDLAAKHAVPATEVLDVKTISVENHRLKGYAIVNSEVLIRARQQGAGTTETTLKLETLIRSMGSKFVLEKLKANR